MPFASMTVYDVMIPFKAYVTFIQNPSKFSFWLQNEARKLNQQEVVEEDKKRKLPANWEAKKARLEWELAENQKKMVNWYTFSC